MKSTAVKQAKSCVNPRLSEEFILCTGCARWGSRGPDPDCSHTERIDLSSASPAELDEMVEMAERITRRREEAQAVLGLLGRSAKRLVLQGKVIQINAVKLRSLRVA